MRNSGLEEIHTDRENDILVSLVIVVHKNHDAARACIESFQATTSIKSEVVVVDNSGQNVEFPHTGKIIHIENKGYSDGVNHGVKQTHGRYVLICNPDVLLLDNSVEKMLEYLERSSDTGVVGPRVYSKNGDVQPTARSFPTSLTVLFNRNSLFTRIFPKNRSSATYLHKYIDATEPAEPDWISGCCMLIRRQAFEEIHGFDDGYFLFMEDVDFCRRLWETNKWRVVYLPDAEVRHTIGISNRRNDSAMIRYRHQSIRHYIDRHYRSKPGIIRGLGKLFITLREFALLLKAKVFPGKRS